MSDAPTSPFQSDLFAGQGSLKHGPQRRTCGAGLNGLSRRAGLVVHSDPGAGQFTFRGLRL